MAASPRWLGVSATSLGWQGEQRAIVVGGKASSGSINEVTGCLLFLLAGEVSERKTVVAGGVVHPLAVEATDGSVPEMVGGTYYFSQLAR